MHTKRATYCHDLIMRTLRMDEDVHSTFVYEQGMRYLELYADACGGETCRAILAEMPDFWLWWRRQWDARNSKFVNKNKVEWFLVYGDDWDRTLLTKLYHFTHDAEFLGREIRVCRSVMQDVVKQLQRR